MCIEMSYSGSDRLSERFKLHSFSRSAIAFPREYDACYKYDVYPQLLSLSVTTLQEIVEVISYCSILCISIITDTGCIAINL
jgi:hypothetical protein